MRAGAQRRPTICDDVAVSRGAPSLRSEIAWGLNRSFAAGLGLVPLGVAFGLLVVQAGLPWWVAPALSIAGFAGSLELLLVGLITAATPLAAIAVTTLLVNFRHVFYAFSFPLGAVRHPAARVYSMYALIDEAFAVTAADPREWTGPRLVTLQLAFQSYWVGGGLLGVALGALLPFRIEGLEFSLCALFVTLALDACRDRSAVPSLLLGAASFAIAAIAVPEHALLVGMLCYVALLIVRFAFVRRGEASRG